MSAPLVVPGLAKCEWNVAILDHVLNLPPHREREKNKEVDDQYGPEYWYIEHIEP